MHNFFLELEYIGINYFGFQIQNNKPKREATIQGLLEEALAKLFKQNIRIVYAGRTDKGVHAKAQGANFKVDTKIPLSNIKEALNSFLPSDIRIKRIKRVPLDFHARFWAKSKVYRYIILNQKQPSVFWKDFAWHIDYFLDIDKMNKSSRLLIGQKDFSIFAKEAKKYKNCIRRITNLSIKEKSKFIYIDIEADGFLRSMVRNIVSFLVRVGSGKLSLKEARLVIGGEFNYTTKPAPGSGLYLLKVNYE